MNKTIHLYADERRSDGRAIRLVNIEYLDDSHLVTKRQLFYDITGIPADALSQDMDFAVLAILFEAMHKQRNIHVHGSVNESLLRNLEEFQLAFSSWFPKVYKPIQIYASHISTFIRIDPKRRAISAFSGGVDGCFTAFRHIHKQPGCYHEDLQAVVLVHGFDISLQHPDAFETAARNSAAILDGLDINLVRIKTNARDFLPDWQQNYCAALGSCLHNLSGKYTIGMISSGEAYQDLIMPWGNSPITNHMLSSDIFKIQTDGAGYTRTQKVAHISEYPQISKYLRVCWEGPQTGTNCCKCNKCILTILNYRANGKPLPACFHTDVSNERLASIKKLNTFQRSFMKEIVTAAKSNGITEEWLSILEDVISRA